MMNKNGCISLCSATPASDPRLSAIRKELGRYIRKEEASYNSGDVASDTLMGHLERVACHAVRLALKEGVDPLWAETAALFHDAGKFHDEQYHEGDKPEEDYAIEILRTLGGQNGLDTAIIEQVSEAIRQLYCDDPTPTPLSMVLFDADNYDKLGLIGIANYFIKSGLRGRGITADIIIQLTVELTYARYATRRFYTKTGRAIVESRSLETIRFIHDFLQSLKDDGLFDARIERICISDLELDVILPSSCPCGASMGIKPWIEKGVKCTEIHLEIGCTACDNRYKIKFCRPLFVV